MQQTFLGRTGVRTSRLAFGTMSFGGDADHDESARMFAACRDAGIDHFDTADVYNGGRSEEILGELLADCRDEVVLATKAYFPTGTGPNDRGSSRYHLVRAVDSPWLGVNLDTGNFRTPDPYADLPADPTVMDRVRRIIPWPETVTLSNFVSVFRDQPFGRWILNFLRD